MPNETLLHEPITSSIIGAFYEVYNELGFGFLEHIYVLALEQELRERGHSVIRQLPVDVVYKDRVLAVQRLDMVVDERIVVEVKSTRALHEMAARQVLNYLRASRLEIGLLLHFGPRASFFRLISSRR
jgi:GxxExxY protein